MDTLPPGFSPRFIVLTICAVVTGLLLGIGISDHKMFEALIVIPIPDFRRDMEAVRPHAEHLADDWPISLCGSRAV